MLTMMMLLTLLTLVSSWPAWHKFSNDKSLLFSVPVNTSIGGSILTFNQQSICTEAGRPADPFNINCVQHRCSQLVGTDLFALQIQVRGKLSP